MNVTKLLLPHSQIFWRSSDWDFEKELRNCFGWGASRNGTVIIHTVNGWGEDHLSKEKIN